jgi:hypothetical protein
MGGLVERWEAKYRRMAGQLEGRVAKQKDGWVTRGTGG